jgi:hypothetical protein
MKEIVLDLLNKLSSHTMTYQESLELSNLLWIYHRTAAKARGISVSQSWWFQKLITDYEQAEYQRWAVDIAKDLLAKNDDEVYLSSLYQTAIDRFIQIINDSISINKE